jgi:hypothetical protein
MGSDHRGYRAGVGTTVSDEARRRVTAIKGADMRQSQTFHPELHKPGSAAARGQCSYHASTGGAGRCAGEAVVSFQDEDGKWQSGCSIALQNLVDRDEIEPLGQGG